MRLKAGQTAYTLPAGVVPHGILIHIRKNTFRLQQFARTADFHQASYYKPQEFPRFWCLKNPWDTRPAQIEIYPAPKKAWKVEIIGTQDVIL